MKLKLYVDDIRPAPEGWIQARTVTDAIKTIARFGSEITDISLDHDISMAVSVGGEYRPFPSPETFQAVAYYIVCMANYLFDWKPNITIHTANPVGGKELSEILRRFNPILSPENRVNRLESEV